jgi:hypothetical protein
MTKETNDEVKIISTSHEVTWAVVKIKADLLMTSVVSVMLNVFTERIFAQFDVCFETVCIPCCFGDEKCRRTDKLPQHPKFSFILRDLCNERKIYPLILQGFLY